MAKDVIINCLVEGGKASGGPPLGPALGPTGINIMSVVQKINELTGDYEGMKCPVTVTVHPDTKSFDVSVKTPPASALMIKEVKAEGGSGKPNAEKVGNLTMEQAIKVAKMKRNVLYAKTLKKAVKTVLGTAVTCGLTVEGKDPRDIQKAIDKGDYDDIFKEGE
ncbi:MAG: 50S ribosomal protein L17 [Promethearchaeota archaeon CR_4]|nr:MAG: 50S ribosomal protein L17 [Candidatus Lokiarchaeota archaeon CR_4]